MASENPTQTNTTQLWCSEIDSQSGSQAVILIHGAFVSGADWDLVTPYLAEHYHLIIPDLPGHGKSKDITFSTEIAARLLADLISERAPHGRAHVVGHSLGAHVAIELASKHPDCVNRVFVSGFQVFDAAPQTIATGMQLESSISSLIPRPLLKWLLDGTDLSAIPSAPSPALRLAVAETLTIGKDQWPKPWPAKTLIVAAGKGGMIPTADHPQDAVKLGNIGRKENLETKVVTHPQMRHPWNRQAPELFARAVRRWFDEGEVEAGFVEL